MAEVAATVMNDARWEYLDVETRRTGPLARDLLLAKAAERSLSPAGRDQLLSVALDRVLTSRGKAAPGVGALLGDTPTETQRRAVRRAVFALGPHRVETTDALVAQLEQFHAGQSKARDQNARIATGLEQDATLHQTLWDDPRVPASAENRLTMLCSIPRLRDRADTLKQANPSWFTAILRVLGSMGGKTT